MFGGRVIDVSDMVSFVIPLTHSGLSCNPQWNGGSVESECLCSETLRFDLTSLHAISMG